MNEDMFIDMFMCISLAGINSMSNLVNDYFGIG